MHLKQLAALAIVAALVLAACGGDDDDSAGTSGDTGSTGAGENATPTQEDNGDDGQEREGVHVPLEAGSVAEIDAPDAGKVRMTIVQILSPADELLGPGLTVDPGFQLWAVEATVEATGAAIPDWFITTDKGNEYTWTGTGGGNDLWSGEIGPDSPAEGYIAFQLPEDEEVVSLTALYSIYVGYDMIFER